MTHCVHERRSYAKQLRMGRFAHSLHQQIYTNIQLSEHDLCSAEAPRLRGSYVMHVMHGGGYVTHSQDGYSLLWPAELWLLGCGVSTDSCPSPRWPCAKTLQHVSFPPCSAPCHSWPSQHPTSLTQWEPCSHHHTTNAAETLHAQGFLLPQKRGFNCRKDL